MFPDIEVRDIYCFHRFLVSECFIFLFFCCTHLKRAAFHAHHLECHAFDVDNHIERDVKDIIAVTFYYKLFFHRHAVALRLDPVFPNGQVCFYRALAQESSIDENIVALHICSDGDFPSRRQGVVERQYVSFFQGYPMFCYRPAFFLSGDDMFANKDIVYHAG